MIVYYVTGKTYKKELVLGAFKDEESANKCIAELKDNDLKIIKREVRMDNLYVIIHDGTIIDTYTDYVTAKHNITDVRQEIISISLNEVRVI